MLSWAELCPPKFIRWGLTPSDSECGLIWGEGLRRGDRVKMSPSGWLQPGRTPSR